MALNPAVPFWDEANSVTCHASAAITGKRFVGISGNRTGDNPTVSMAAAAAAPVGVSAYDAGAGTKLTVYTGHEVMPVEAGAAITAGTLLIADGTGRAIPKAGATTPTLGIAWSDAAGAGSECVVKINL